MKDNSYQGEQVYQKLVDNTMTVERCQNEEKAMRNYLKRAIERRNEGNSRMRMAKRNLELLGARKAQLKQADSDEAQDG